MLRVGDVDHDDESWFSSAEPLLFVGKKKATRAEMVLTPEKRFDMSWLSSKTKLAISRDVSPFATVRFPCRRCSVGRHELPRRNLAGCRH